MPEPSEVTQLLKSWCSGDQQAFEQLALLVEKELRSLARHHLSKESAGHTLQPTALVNEIYLRLIEWNTVDWQGRAHFYAVAAKMMRRVLVNHAIAGRRQKRGDGTIFVSLTEANARTDRAADVVALDDALVSLANLDSRKSQIVELRFFGGLSAEETAEVLGVSLRTVCREWDLARSWLFRELQRNRGG